MKNTLIFQQCCILNFSIHKIFFKKLPLIAKWHKSYRRESEIARKSAEVQLHLPFDPTILFLEIDPKDTLAKIWNDMDTGFLFFRKHKENKTPSVSCWVNKPWYILTVNVYITFKKKPMKISKTPIWCVVRNIQYANLDVKQMRTYECIYLQKETLQR